MKSLSEKAPELFHFVRLLQSMDLSDTETFHQAKRVVADTVGVAYSGVHSAAFRTALRSKKMISGEGSLVIWGTRETANLPGAVFYNALSVSLTDFDEGHRKAVGHPASVVVPVALTLGEYLKKPYNEMLKAVIIGYEAGTRFSQARLREKINSYSTGRWGALASAASAAYLLDLNTEQFMHALSLAFVTSPAMQRGSTDVSTGSMAKEGIPWAVRSGLQSALLAREGFTGPYLFIDAYDDVDKEKLVAGTKNKCLINSNYFKPYSCCRWLQTAVSLALQLKKAHQLDMEETERIEVRIFERALKLINSKYPENVVQAQFHLPFVLSCALLFDEVTPWQVSKANLHNESIKKLIDNIRLIPDDSFSAGFPEKLASKVDIFLKDGSQVSASGDCAPWDAKTPPTDEELHQKFAQLTGNKSEIIWRSIFGDGPVFTGID